MKIPSPDYIKMRACIYFDSTISHLNFGNPGWLQPMLSEVVISTQQKLDMIMCEFQNCILVKVEYN